MVDALMAFSFKLNLLQQEKIGHAIAHLSVSVSPFKQLMTVCGTQNVYIIFFCLMHLPHTMHANDTQVCLQNKVKVLHNEIRSKFICPKMKKKKKGATVQIINEIFCSYFEPPSSF